MPRRVRTRATRPSSDLDPALLEFLIGGDGQAAIDSRKARGLPILLFFRSKDMARVWRERRAEILAEAERRGLNLKDLYGECYDRYDPTTQTFAPAEG